MTKEELDRIRNEKNEEILYRKARETYLNKQKETQRKIDERNKKEKKK